MGQGWTATPVGVFLVVTITAVTETTPSPSCSGSRGRQLVHTTLRNGVLFLDLFLRGQLPDDGPLFATFTQWESVVGLVDVYSMWFINGDFFFFGRDSLREEIYAVHCSIWQVSYLYFFHSRIRILNLGSYASSLLLWYKTNCQETHIVTL